MKHTKQSPYTVPDVMGVRAEEDVEMSDSQSPRKPHWQKLGANLQPLRSNRPDSDVRHEGDPKSSGETKSQRQDR
jgi:hypothetical protein